MRVTILSVGTFFLVFLRPSGSTQNETQLCTKYLGCFDNNPPWYSLKKPFPLPQDPDIVDTKFYLSTRRHPHVATNIPKDPSINLDGFDYKSHRWTVLIVHGFASAADRSWVIELADSYLRKVDANVFRVDWSGGANQLNYLQAAANVRIVAAEVARLIVHLIKEEGQSPKKVHCIGHSLGAHVCGLAGKITNSSGAAIDWITGLDPAGPGFELTDPITRLQPDDATFVEAYHTDAKPMIPFFGFGMIMPTAQVDFYMNGGFLQPGCTVLPGIPKIRSISDLYNIPVEYIKQWISCPHSRAAKYYISALNGCIFVGKPYYFNFKFKMTEAGQMIMPQNYGRTTRSETTSACDPKTTTCQLVGLLSRGTTGRGSFYVKTGAKKPYCVPLNKHEKSWFRRAWDYMIAVKMRKLGMIKRLFCHFAKWLCG